MKHAISTRLIALAFAVFLSGAAQAVTATFNGANDVPITANGYSATGNSVDLTLNFAPPTGTPLTVINNTSLDFISGTFENLAQGQAVALGYGGATYNFVANYYGGTGNDLVLVWAGTRVMAWGDNSFGQLGNNSTSYFGVLWPSNVDATEVLAGKTVIAVAAGQEHSLALCSDGTIAAWGENGLGQLGNNTTTSSTVPVAVITTGTPLEGKTVIAISAGFTHNLALCSDGTIASWGDNHYGQLGNNTTTSSTVPVTVVATGTPLEGKTVIAVSAGGYFSLALCSDGTMVAWGNNSYGKLGNNSTTTSLLPVAVLTTGTPLEDKTVIAVAAGQEHSLALCSDGTMATCGHNKSGQLGNNTTTDSMVPAAVVTTGTPLEGKNVIAVSAGSFYNLVLCSDGTMCTWGDNIGAQLGNNTTSKSLLPVAVVTTGTPLEGKTVVAVSASAEYSLALCSDGTLAFWGTNGVIDIDPYFVEDSWVPIAVNTSSLGPEERFVSVASAPGAWHSLALVAPIVNPTIAFSGNGQPIEFGGPASATNGTEYGTVPLLNSRVTHYFTIRNTGTEPLQLTGSPLINITGSGASDFHVNLQPNSTIAVGNSTAFAITYSPSALGQRLAMVTVGNSSPIFSNYQFTLAGDSSLTVKRAQTIQLDAPTIAVPYYTETIHSQSTSGLPVSLTITGPATLTGHSLQFSGAGTVKITATQTGNNIYLPASPVTRTIIVKNAPSTLTFYRLNQVYDGSPKTVYAFDARGASATVYYIIAGNYGLNPPTNAGSYLVKAISDSTTITGTLVIAKAPLLVSPDNQHKFAGQANPPLTFTCSGFLNRDTSSVITKAPVLATTATTASVGGVYPITASGGLAANYTFVFGLGSMAVNTFAGNYEALLADADLTPVGKLNITVAATSKTFTAKLYTATESGAVSFAGPLVTANEQATGTATTLVGVAKTPYVINITLPWYSPVSASAMRGGVSLGSATDGQRLGTNTVLFAGAHTAVLEPATPATANFPPGAGWATVSASSTGVLSFVGRLGDDTVFTASLSPDMMANPGYRLFAQPYVASRTQSYLAGQFNLAAHPSIANRRYLAQSPLTWKKAGLVTDATNRNGFGPVSTVLMIDPWLPPAVATKTAPAISLGQRLGLTGTTFHVSHTDTGSGVNGSLPTLLNLSATNVVSVLTPLANPTKWKTLTFSPATGTFTGSFELLDAGKKRTPTFSGVLRQPATAQDALIGNGHYLLVPTTGTEQSTGEVMFTK